MTQRILNMGFFNLNDEYLDALKELDILEEEAFESVRSKTYLPMIDNMRPPYEVFALVRMAVESAKPQRGDVIITSGAPDVVSYIMQLLKLRDESVTVLMPLGNNRGGKFTLLGFREIMQDVNFGDNEEVPEAVYMNIEDGGGWIGSKR